MDILVSGFLLAGTYALVAFGLNLQYGVALIMNLANGEMLVLGALAAFWLYINAQVSPLLTVVLVGPIAFAGNWLIYRFLIFRRAFFKNLPALYREPKKPCGAGSFSFKYRARTRAAAWRSSCMKKRTRNPGFSGFRAQSAWAKSTI